MADKEKDLKIKFDGVTLEDEPKKYLQAIYAEGAEHQEDKLRSINLRNRLFFEGNDPQLEARGNDKKIVRSALFINDVKTAIDVRIAGVLAKIEESGNPIVIKPRAKDPSKEELEGAKWIEREITQQLRDTGYLSDIFEEHIQGSEIYRSPSAVKVGWTEGTVRAPRLIIPTEDEIRTAALNGEVPVQRVEYHDKVVGKPFVEWLDTDEFLYDPHCSSLDRDCSYTIHSKYMFYHDIVSLGKEMHWDMKKVKSMKDIFDEEYLTENYSSADTSIRDDLKAARDESTSNRGYRDGKILVAEFNIPSYDDGGNSETRNYVMLGGLKIVDETINKNEEVIHPFVVARSNPLPGSLENFSSVDIGMPIGKFNNELYNSWVDGTVYSMFSILIRDAGSSLIGDPRISPGAIWEAYPDKDSIRPLLPYQTQLRDFTPLLTHTSNRLRDILNTPDLAQGFNATPNEKATSSRLRAAGSARRFVPINRRYGNALIQVADLILKFNRLKSKQAAKFILDVVIDAPGLTNIVDTEREKEEAMVLLAQMQENPVYQTPNGLRKIRNQTDSLVRLLKDKHVNIDDFVPTAEEVENQIKDDLARKNVEIDMAGVTAPQPQGNQNG